MDQHISVGLVGWRRASMRFWAVWVGIILAGQWGMLGGEFLRLGPMLGHVDGETGTAKIWVKASGPSQVGVRMSTRPDLGSARDVVGPVVKADTDFAGEVSLSGLKPSEEYYYGVTLDGALVMSPPFPSFRVPKVDRGPGRLRFAFVSCSGYAAQDPAAGWADLGLRTNVDLILMLGDNHYANSPELGKQRAAYLDQRRSVGFGWITSRTPVYGIWDDHDFGPNDSDSTMPGREEAFRSFREHWANPGYGEEDNLGVYFKFVRGDVEFFCLDGRYFRSPNKAPDGAEKTMLGARQLAWLKAGLAESKATFKVLASGGEWQSHGTPDSWTSFKREREEIFAWIREHQITGVVLLSGDRHFTAGYQVQGRFVEVSSGPIGGNTAETKPTPEMFLYQGKGRFYCVMELDSTMQPPVAGVEVYRVGMGLAERRAFTWDELNGQSRIPTLPLMNENKSAVKTNP